MPQDLSIAPLQRHCLFIAFKSLAEISRTFNCLYFCCEFQSEIPRKRQGERCCLTALQHQPPSPELLSSPFLACQDFNVQLKSWCYNLATKISGLHGEKVPKFAWGWLNLGQIHKICFRHFAQWENLAAKFFQDAIFEGHVPLPLWPHAHGSFPSGHDTQIPWDFTALTPSLPCWPLFYLLPMTLRLDGRRCFIQKMRDEQSIRDFPDAFQPKGHPSNLKIHCTLYLLFGNQWRGGISRIFSLARNKFIALEKHSFTGTTIKN